jgi:hypothetical protein
MTNEREPARWCDAPDPELPAELVAAFAHYGSSGPGAAQQARMGEELTRALGHAAPRPWLRAWKVWLGGVLLLAAAWGGLRSLRTPETSPPPAPTEVAAPGRASVVAPEQSAVPEQAVVSPQVAEPAAVDAPIVPAAEERSAVVPPARREGKRARAAQPLAESAAVSAELALLVPARKLVAVDAARALALAEQHAREYVRGAFSEEREVIAVEALVRLGRTADARARVRGFVERHPGSSHLAHLRELTGDE